MIEEIGELSPLRGEPVLDAAGGALLPGLHDHHLHLLATARARTSVDVSDGLDILRDVPGTGWVRAVGLAGPLDAAELDRIVGDRSVRVQHRSGALWVLSSKALRELGIHDACAEGVEVAPNGIPTGRLWRLDDWLGDRMGHPDPPPDLTALGAELLDLGITGVTDATPHLTEPALALLTGGGLPQRLQLLATNAPATLAGPWKIVLADHALPTLDEVVAEVRRARGQGRAVAAHCVTRTAVVLVMSALAEVGPVHGDRLEHAAVVDHDLAAWAASLGVTVCTQPGFLAARGDDYLREVAPEDLPDLYPYARLVAAGVATVCSSDAPHGPLDPWAVLRAARDRTSRTGTVLGPDERVSVSQALDGYLRPLADLSAPARRVSVGAPAELVLMRMPLSTILAEPSADLVHTAWISPSTLEK